MTEVHSFMFQKKRGLKQRDYAKRPVTTPLQGDCELSSLIQGRESLILFAKLAAHEWTEDPISSGSSTRSILQQGSIRHRCLRSPSAPILELYSHRQHLRHTCYTSSTRTRYPVNNR